MQYNLADTRDGFAQSVPASFSRPSSMADYVGALSLCCIYAREAAAEGRFLAAHHLFQGALGYFDRAQQIATRCSTKALLPSNNAYELLVATRAELDDCAREVYADISYPSSASLEQGEGIE